MTNNTSKIGHITADIHYTADKIAGYKMHKI